MKLPDFSGHVELNQLRQQMGAELIPWESGGRWDPIDIELDGEGIEIPLEEIEYDSDGTLGYEGRKVVVYIRDQSHRDQYALDSYELIDPEDLRKFHVADCQTLSQMRRQGRYERYVVTTRSDGNFTVNFLRGGRLIKEAVECRLYVCKKCLSKLDYKDYRKKKMQQNEIRESFDLNEFFEMYGSRITKKPTGTDITAPVNTYSPNWDDEISPNYKEKMKWKCEECGIDLREEKKFLEVHHINGLKYDNEEKNLRALCIDCHVKQFQHQHMKHKPKHKEFLQWRSQQ